MAGSSKRLAGGSDWDDAGDAPPVPVAPSEAAPAARLRLVARSDNPSRRRASLARTVEVEVIPRLVLARRAAEPVAPACERLWAPGPQAVADFTGAVLTDDCAAARIYVDEARAHGTSVETLYLDLLTPVARRLGEMWTEDLCSFGEVTLALGHLQHVMRELGPAFRSEVARPPHGRRAMLVPLPGEQHTFGLHMVAEFFRRAGWDVASGPFATIRELVGVVRSEWFAVVGLSMSGERGADALASGIRAIRRASRNRAIGVLVGGPVFLEHPELVALVGADATAADARQATRQAQNLLALLPRSCC